MKRYSQVFSLILAMVFAISAFGQSPSSSAAAAPVSAYSFAYGASMGGPSALQVTSGSTGTGSYTVTVANGQLSTAQGVKFAPLSTNAPVMIGLGASFEIVTPSAVSCSTPTIPYTCSFTATFSYAHGPGDQVKSGDYGLQEAATYLVNKGGGLLALTPDWFTAEGGHSAGLTALVTYKSLATGIYTVLDLSGATGALSYAANSGSVYASTTHVLY